MSKASDYAKAIKSIPMEIKFGATNIRVDRGGDLYLPEMGLSAELALKLGNWIIENFSEPDAEIWKPMYTKIDGTWREGGKI